MSGKRQMTQLTKDEAYAIDRREEEEDDRDGPIEAPKIASQDVMARRKIAQYKPRLTGGSKPAVSQPTESKAANLFSMFSKPTSTITTTSSSPSTPSSTKLDQKKSLNSNFLQAVNNAITKNSVCNLKPLVTRYIEYFDKIESNNIEVKNLETPKVNVNPIPADGNFSFGNPSVPALPIKPIVPTTTQSSSITTTTTTSLPTSEPKVTEESSVGESKDTEMKGKAGDDSDSEDDEIKIQGPYFKLEGFPKSKSSGFKFGYAPPTEVGSDSEDEIEIKGPSFKFDPSTIKKNGGFKLPTINKKDESNKLATPSTGFTFGAAAPSTNEKKEEPNLSSGSSTDVVVTSDKKDVGKPATTGFTFGTAPVTTEKKEETKPVTGFTFGATSSANENKNDTPAAVAKPIFTGFGSTPDTDSKSPFSFGSTPSSEKKDGVPAPAKLSFNFGAGFGSTTTTNTTTDSVPAKPAFSFANTPSSSSMFGNTPHVTKAPESTSKPTSAFSFTAPAPSSTTTTTPASSNPFSFTTSESSTSTTVPSAGSFNFSFSAPKSDSTSTTSPETTNGISSTGAQDQADENDVKGDFTVHKLTHKVEVKTGEEDETTIYTKRSKLLKFNNETKTYESRGLGDIKVLTNNQTGKSRILLRSEGNSNVLLNSSIVAGLKYEATANTVRIPVAKPDSGIEMYTVKVKTTKDAADLMEKIQSCQ